MRTAPASTLADLQARHGPRYRWLLLSVMIGTMASIMGSVAVSINDNLDHA